MVIGLRILQVDLLMGHIQIPAVDHGLALFQTLHVAQEGLLPLHPVVKPCKLPLGIGHIDRNHEILLIFRGNHPPFLIVLLRPDAEGYLQRLLL